MATDKEVKQGHLKCAHCGTEVLRFPCGHAYPTFYCPKCDGAVCPHCTDA